MRPRVPFRFFSTTQRHLADGPLVTFPKPTSRPVRSSHLPHGYTYYKSHNDVPTLPPPATARVYESELEPPHIPRCSVFHYLFPPTKKGKQPKYYLVPDPKTVAFIDGLTGRTLFRSDLPIQATWTRSGLRKLGVGKGDVACIFGENSLEWVSACYGAQAAALVVSPSNYAYTPTELLYQLKDSGAKLIFVSPALLPTLLKALELGAPSYTIPQYRIILMCQPSEKPADTPYSCIQDLWNKAGRPKEMQSDEERDTAYLCYSSGTTGRAKGVETSHHNMTSQVQAIRNAHHTMRASDAILGVLPFGHIYGLTFLLHHPLTVHAPVIVLPRFDVDNVLKAIEKYKITWGLVVPPMLMALMKAPKFDSYDLSTLFGVLCGAAPCSVDLIKAFENRFPKIAAPRGFGVPDSVKPSCRVTQGYGLTEASPATHVMNLREGIEHQGSIGRIMPTMQARLVDVVSGMDVPRGEPGELWVRGPSVMKGYWKNTEATKDAFAEGGWLKSGDLATVDEDGYFYIVDQVKELIKYKGYQVPPAELEALLLNHPLIVDSGVIGVHSSSQATELPQAYVVPRGGLRAVREADRPAFAADIARWLKGKVADHKQLRGGVVLVDTIPRSSSGKILRKDLRARAAKELEVK